MSHVLLRPVRLRALTSAHAPRRLALGRGPLSDLSRTVKRNPRGRRPTPSYNSIIFQSNIVFLRLCEKRTPSHSHTRSPSRDSVYGAYSTSRAPAAHRSPHGGAPSLPPAARHSPCRPLYKSQTASQSASRERVRCTAWCRSTRAHFHLTCAQAVPTVAGGGRLERLLAHLPRVQRTDVMGSHGSARRPPLGR